ncbi:MAG: M48 family metallopeptidase [Bacteroidales bacterium]|jgi:putative metalloprotease|nr:M48 family metallopeptidase [Bacteroidales bacterium]MBQ5401755.1 M48 family metallopeptidase [Bacteroidales bacterium]
MKRILLILAVAVMTSSCGVLANVDPNLALSGASKAIQALTISDEQIQAYVRQSVIQMDAQNKVSPATSSYSKRLANLTRGLTDVDGLPLNFKVYETKQVNAFACADGSVRVYSGLMDLLSDDEVLGVIGHEIGHVALKHSKKEMQNAYLTSAALDGLGSMSTSLASLSQSQLRAFGEAALNARYSKKQELQADDYGYEFLKAKGKNPIAMIKSFQKMLALKNSQSSATSSSMNQLLSSHPDLETRINRIAEKAIADGYVKVKQ